MTSLRTAAALCLFTPLCLTLPRLVSEAGAQAVKTDSTYNELVSLFSDWRRFQRPPRVDGVYDYSPPAMARQHQRLAGYLGRLSRIDTTGWPVSQKVDHHLVLAEMNGLDFDHRVRRPWARDPAFYVMVFPSQTDVVPREGPVIEGAIELWQYDRPLSAEDDTELARRIGTIPIQLDHAMRTLTGNGRDLWMAGIRRMNLQHRHLETFADEIEGSSAELVAAVRRAIDATAIFVQWLESESSKKDGPSGIGADNYTWYLQNVHLVPYTWEEQVTLVRRELTRAHASLRLEEHRNRNLPELEPIGSAGEYEKRLSESVAEYLEFLDSEEILSVRDYMEAALMERIGSFTPPDGPRSFFSEVNYREPLIMRAHHYHWFDIARIKEIPHESPIRSTPLLSNIYDSRAEGLATGMEEMMMHAGLLDDLPRARELVWVMLAQRAARALAALYMHGNVFTMQEAIDFASDWTPRGWLPAADDLVWHEQHLYLQQPGYGTSYVVGKIEVERLLADYARRKGDTFVLKDFMDTMDASGVIPVSLIRWEITGLADQIRAMHARGNRERFAPAPELH